MSTLEDTINDALSRGELVHLSVAASGKMFRATFASASRAGHYSHAEAADPIVAMVRAITSTPMKRKPSGVGAEYTKNMSEIVDDDPALS